MMHYFERQQRFSQSLIWQLRRDYFSQVGIDAWRSGEVPHTITSNPVMGKTYAELVLAFLRDLSLRGQREETVYLLELGAGHGRLCYCLERLRQLSRQGLVLLSADKGEHHLSNSDHRPAPQLATHGSFSLTVNYHALKEYCTRQGGLALLPRHQ